MSFYDSDESERLRDVLHPTERFEMDGVEYVYVSDGLASWWVRANHWAEFIGRFGHEFQGLTDVGWILRMCPPVRPEVEGRLASRTGIESTV